MNNLPFGQGVFIHCPLDDCNWKFRVDEPKSRSYTFRDLTPEGLNEGFNRAVVEKMRDTEQAIREHSATHDVIQWVQKVRQLQQRLGQYERIGDEWGR